MSLAEQTPTLTPALSLREGEGALFETLAPALSVYEGQEQFPKPSPPEGERAG